MTDPAASARWRRNHFVVVAMVFVVFTGFAFVLPFLTLFVQELGVTDREAAASWAGVLIGVAPLLAGLLAPLWGRHADRHGQKPTALRALACYVALMVLSAAVTNVWQLLLLRIGIGLTGGIGPLGLAMATANAPRSETGRVVGVVQAAQILSAAIGPFAGGAIAALAGSRAAFLAAAALCAVALALVAWGYEEAPRAPAALDPGTRTSLGDVWRMQGVPALLVVLFLVNFVGRSFTPILPLHLKRLGAGEAAALATGALISAYSLAAALSASAFGRAAKAFSPLGLLAASLAAGAATILPMAWASTVQAMIVLATLAGLASGGGLTLGYTIGGLLVPAERRTTAFGFFSGAALFGGAVAPSVAGFLAHWRLEGIYYADAALFLALAIAVGLGPRPSLGR
jgi:MFS family permease